MRTKTTAAIGLALAAALLSAPIPASASKTGDIYFVNGNDNPSSFACYWLSGSTWKKIPMASGATISHTTKVKCSSAWRARILGGSTLPGQVGANQVTSFNGVDTGVYNTVSVLKV